MVKYFSNDVDIRTTWDHVVSAFWQRYPNPFSTHVLTEDVVLREVTADQRLLSRRLLTKTNRMPRWAEFLFPSNLSRSVYIVEDSVVDPVTKSLTTYTWNLNHTTLMEMVSAPPPDRGTRCVSPTASSSGAPPLKKGNTDTISID
uniref:PRELI/MSF1 domain-containing protein n=1 Tax=Oncorhynchus tshawytscha TaxID=74940 RepID=A0AAZ3R822_ONCTS